VVVAPAALSGLPLGVEDFLDALLAVASDTHMNITTPYQGGFSGSTFTEPPLAVHLSVQGPTVTGQLVFAGVLAGQYSVEPFAGQSAGDIGSVTTANLGYAQSGGTSDGGAIVLAVRKAREDIVVVFGWIGSTVPGSIGSTASADPYPTKETMCIADQQTQTTIVYPSQVRIVYRRNPSYGATGWYELGTASFPVAYSSLAGGGAFYYYCQPEPGGVGASF